MAAVDRPRPRPALARFADAVSHANTRVGEALAWLLPAMTAATLVSIAGYKLFAVGWVWLAELVLYMHAGLFMLAAAYTLAAEGHVRIDVFHARLGRRGQALVDLVGVGTLLLPTVAAIFWWSWGYVMDAWAVREGSQERAGLHAVYLLKTCLLVMPAMLALQGLALAARAILTLQGHDPHPPGQADG